MKYLKPRRLLRKCRNRNNQLAKNRGRQIQYYNVWQQPFDEIYWSRWFKAHPALLAGHPDLKIGVFSVFGSRDVIKHTSCDVNIFYTSENLKNKNYWSYSDSFLSEPKIDLSMGYEYFDNERYCRFPNWMDVFFLTLDDVTEVCNRLRFPDCSQKERFASLVCRHDSNGVRGAIMDALSAMGEVACPGKFRHNDDSLFLDFNDDKISYLRQFYFNICPENANAMGYVTEKLFHAIASGCIPIYWGSYNQPELEVVNRDAVIFWEPDGDNAHNISFIEDLVRSPQRMKEFLSQPRLLPTAEEYISETLATVERKISKLLGSK